MRTVEVNFVVASSDAVGAAQEAWAALAAVSREGVECLVVHPGEGPAGDLARVAGATAPAPRLISQPDIANARADIARIAARDRTISIGATRWDIGLAATSLLHFHTGDAAFVPGKIPGLVPLCGQGSCGVRNVLDWVARVARSGGMDVVDHADIVRFADASSRDFHRPGKTRQAARLACSLADRIQARFPEVEAVIGGGFPFYSVEMADGGPGNCNPVPASILNYIDSQRDYFRSKVAPHGTPPDLIASRSELRGRGLEPDRNAFDVYEFAREGVKPPGKGPERGTIEQFVAANELDFASALWPCHLCAELHDEAKFPRQAFIRDFMRTCAQCRQTTLIPRNVGGVSCDIDLVVVARLGRADRALFAREVGRWIDAQDDIFRYDTDFEQQLVCCKPPTDVFVTSSEEFWQACDRIRAGSGWDTVTLSSTALWLPVTEHELGLGVNFALCAEPIRVRDPGWSARFSSVRQAFASAVTAEEVVVRLAGGSFYHQQLMRNPEIHELIAERLRTWRAAEPVRRSPE